MTRAVIVRPPFDPATTALVAAMSSTPDFPRQQHIDRLIRALKKEGIWDKLDLFYMLAAHAEQAGQLNWIAPGTNTLAPANTPTFTTDRGYTGNGSNTTLDTNFNPATAGGKYALDDAMNAAWTFNTDHGTMSLMGTGGTALLRSHSTATQMSTRGNAGTTNNFTTGTPATGLHGWSRAASTGYATYRNGALVNTVTQTSTAISSADIHILSGGVASNLTEATTHEVACALSGAAIDADQWAALHENLLLYLAAVGAL